MKMQIKTFLLGKDGEENGRQDVLRHNIEKGLYVVADGVSNSFHPEIVARILSERFVSMNPEEITDWKELPNIILLPGINDFWQSEVDEYMSSLNGRLLRHEQYNYETWKVGASTFCGIHYDETNELIRFAILGDSTLFIHLKDGQVREINSSIKHIEEGLEITDFSNSTDAILSDGTFVGEWLFGEMSILDISSISIMTDGMAKWFQKNRIKGLSPEQILWELQTNEMFLTLAETARKNGDMDDDLAVILIKSGVADSQCESITTGPSLDKIQSEIDSMDSHHTDKNDIESDISEEQYSVDTELSSIETIGISENPIKLESEENFEVIERTTSLSETLLNSMPNDTPSGNDDEINSCDVIAKEDEPTRKVIAETERIIENNESSADNNKKDNSGGKSIIDSEVTIETNDFNETNVEIEPETEYADKLKKLEDTVHRPSLIDKIKATLRIWRNYPTDPTK